MSQNKNRPGPWRGTEAATASRAASSSSLTPDADIWDAAQRDAWGVPYGEPGNYQVTRAPAFIDGYVSGLAQGVELGWQMAYDIAIRCGTPEERRAYRQGHVRGVEVGRAALLEEMFNDDELEFRAPRDQR